MKFDHARFFTALPSGLCSKTARPHLEGLLARIEADDGWTVLEQVAYFLATIAHETGFTFRPVREKRASKTRQPELWARQERYWPSRFYGRGYVQITWEANYRKAGEKMEGSTINGLVVGPETFVLNPDLVLDPVVAYEIAARGMRGGWFTSKALRHYIGPNVSHAGGPPMVDYKGARRIINGTDKAAEIAALAEGYERALRESQEAP